MFFKRHILFTTIACLLHIACRCHKQPSPADAFHIIPATPEAITRTHEQLKACGIDSFDRTWIIAACQSDTTLWQIPLNCEHITKICTLLHEDTAYKEFKNLAMAQGEFLKTSYTATISPALRDLLTGHKPMIQTVQH